MLSGIVLVIVLLFIAGSLIPRDEFIAHFRYWLIMPETTGTIRSVLRICTSWRLESPDTMEPVLRQHFDLLNHEHKD